MTRKKEVVDRAGFGYSSRVKNLMVANRVSRLTETLALPKLMANQYRAGEALARLLPALTKTNKERSHGYP